jgi:hypothetical protein
VHLQSWGLWNVWIMLLPYLCSPQVSFSPVHLPGLLGLQLLADHQLQANKKTARI